MKKPNKFLEKKYISSLVIAAFLILSVLTAYNVKVGHNNSGEENTEVEETIGNNDDVISSGDARLEEDGREDADSRDDNDEVRTRDTERRTAEEDDEEDSGEDSEDQGNTSEEENGENSEESNAGDTFSYDGKRKLTWPVVGNVILPYSMDTTVYYTTLDQYACNDGILISAKKGDKVRAAADGRVVNISDSDRYGKTVTVLIGDYYEVYYSQLENVKLNVGDEIREGDVIGNVAEPTRAFNLEGPHLFFKMTYKGEPVNPSDYLES